MPFFQAQSDLHLAHSARLLIRTAADPEYAMRDVRQELRRSYPTVSISGLNRVTALIERHFIVERMIATLSLYFGGFAVVLAMIGVYGLLSQQVVQRTREIAIRVALGASKPEILWAILRRTVGALVVGTVVGVAIAASLGRLVTSLLFEVAPVDLSSYVAVATLLLGIALLAMYLPTRRATGIHPMEALRYE